MLPDAIRSKLDELVAQDESLAKQLEDPEVMSDHRAVRDLSIKRAAIEPVVRGYRRYRSLRADIDELRAAQRPGGDADLAEMAKEELPGLEAEAERCIEEVKAALVQSDDRTIGSVILEIRAGAGGDEAGLWARDLLEMYTRYAAGKGWKVETLDLTEDGGVGGIRHATLSISGEAVFAELGFEGGVHSVKRVPATESQGRIHTSTATVAVLPEPEEVDVTIDWAKDVEEHITTAQGPGGQNVNKVATAVHLLHKETGIEVRMQESKSQHQNREKARRLMMARLYELERAKADAERGVARRSQIGTGERSEKVRVYRYQDDITADQRLTTKYKTQQVLAGELGPVIEALMEQETARRLAAL